MIPIQFEYIDDGIVKFVQVLERFRFHFSEEIMIRISTQWVSPLTGSPMVRYSVHTEDEIRAMLETRVDM